MIFKEIIFKVFLAGIFLLVSEFLHAHSVQIAYCVSCSGDLRIFVEHWPHAGNPDPSTTTMTISLTINGITTTQTSSPQGSLTDVPFDSLPGCSSPISSAAGCTDANIYSDWVIYDYTGIPCGVPVIFTIISGNNDFTDDGCGMYPLSVNFNMPCDPGPIPDVYVCEGQSTNPIILPSGSTWTNSNPAIGLPASGNGNIPSFTAIGPTATATISYSSNCVNGSFTMNINPFPTAAFNAPPVCLGSATTFINLSTGGGTSWNWDFGDGSTSNQQNPPLHTYTASNTYSVTLTILQTGCPSTITQIVTVNAAPTASFSSNIVCFNSDSTVFADASTGPPNQWTWDFGDGNTSTLQNPSHTYGTPGTFSVTLTASNGTCVDSVTFTTIVNPLPVALFTSASVCSDDTMCFTNTSSITSGTITGWSWNFGDPGSGSANTSILKDPCHKYVGPGPFTVILTATSDSGCQSTIMLPATIMPPPTAALSATSPCLGTTTTLMDATVPVPGDPIASWSWSMPGGTPSTSSSQTPSTIYATAGTHTVLFSVISALGCKDTVIQQVGIYNPPTANFGSPMNGCAPVCNTYIDSSLPVDGIISNWQWFFPGGSPISSSSQSPANICYDTPGTYSVALIVTSNYGCKDSLTLPMVQVYNQPTSDFCVTPAQAPAADPVFTFCDQWSSDVMQWAWDFGDNDSDIISTDPVHSYAAAIINNDFYNFNICLIVKNQYGCMDTECKAVEVLPEFTFYTPNTFTPNLDLANEMFFGKSRGVKEYNMWIFDRWGNQVWDCHYTGKNTDWDGQGQDGLSSYCKWNGEIRGGKQFALQDVYLWKVILTDIFDISHTYRGHVNVVR